MNVKIIAKICHEANRALCEASGDHSQVSWELAEEWQRESAVRGVQFRIYNPNASAAAQHEAWCNDKIKDGWEFGPVKDAVKKEHPCLVPYDELPFEQRAKDYVFSAIVNAALTL